MYAEKHLYFYITENKICAHKEEIGNNSTKKKFFVCSIYVILVVVYRYNYDIMSVLTTYIDTRVYILNI